MSGLFSMIGLIALWSFGLFVTVYFWLIGVAAFLQWVGIIA